MEVKKGRQRLVWYFLGCQSVNVIYLAVFSRRATRPTSSGCRGCWQDFCGVKGGSDGHGLVHGVGRLEGSGWGGVGV